MTAPQIQFFGTHAATLGSTVRSENLDATANILADQNTFS
jgi:hypothetical protein